MRTLQGGESKATRALSLVIACQLAFSALAMSVFVLKFHFPFNTVLLHLNIVLCLFLVAFILSGALASLFRFQQRWLTPLPLLPPALLATALNLLYLADYASHSIWGRNVSLALILHFLPFTFELLEDSSLPPAAFVAGLWLIVALSMVPYALLGEGLSRSSAEVFWGEGKKDALRRRAESAVLAGLLSLLLFALLPSGQQLLTALAWQQEPLVNLLYRRNPTFPQTAYRLRVGAADRLAERLYRGRPMAAWAGKKNVALIIIDDLRADHLPAYGYARPVTPFLDSMAASGKLRKVDNALSHGSESVGGILATLSSHVSSALSAQNFSVLEAFRKLGFSVHLAFAGNEHWYNLESNYGAEPDEYLFHDGDALPTGADAEVVSALESLPPAGAKPAFFFIHLMSVHWTGLADHRYDRYLPASQGGIDLLEPKTGVSAAWTERRINFYDNRILQADDILRRIFATLAKKGYTQSFSAVILADHGEAFGEHSGDVGHGAYVYQENLRIPFFLYDTHFPSEPYLGFATQLDAAPSLVAAAGFTPPPNWEGRSLFLPPLPTRLVIHDASPLDGHTAAGVTYWTPQGSFKLMWLDYRDGKIIDEKFFDLGHDPLEQHNAVERADPAMLSMMREALKKYYLEFVPDGG